MHHWFCPIRLIHLIRKYLFVLRKLDSLIDIDDGNDVTVHLHGTKMKHHESGGPFEWHIVSLRTALVYLVSKYQNYFDWFFINFTMTIDKSQIPKNPQMTKSYRCLTLIIGMRTIMLETILCLSTITMALLAEISNDWKWL